MENNIYSMAAQYASVSMDYMRGAGNAIARNSGKIAVVGLAALVLTLAACSNSGNCSDYASISHERKLNDSRKERGHPIFCAGQGQPETAPRR